MVEGVQDMVNYLGNPSYSPQMSVPLFKKFFKPILTFMSDGEIHTNKELRQKVFQ